MGRVSFAVKISGQSRIATYLMILWWQGPKQRVRQQALHKDRGQRRSHDASQGLEH